MSKSRRRRRAVVHRDHRMTWRWRAAPHTARARRRLLAAISETRARSCSICRERAPGRFAALHGLTDVRSPRRPCPLGPTPLLTKPCRSCARLPCWPRDQWQCPPPAHGARSQVSQKGFPVAKGERGGRLEAFSSSWPPEHRVTFWRHLEEVDARPRAIGACLARTLAMPHRPLQPTD